ncbi:hypothetical protein WG66_009225 [Moniliophthora roreri]|nr:hypothetical protein WG66_009225 [Moniliophthora roreri]
MGRSRYLKPIAAFFTRRYNPTSCFPWKDLNELCPTSSVDVCEGFGEDEGATWNGSGDKKR